MSVNTVELIGVYGGDLEHAMSAWCSTRRELTSERKQRIPEFLKDLARNGHHTPFEKSALHFLVTCDIASHIHLIKHRIGVSVNAESARYKELKEDRFYIPVDWPEEEKILFQSEMDQAFADYHARLKRLESRGFTRKRAKESARFSLPYANQIACDVQFNFRSFMHFCKLRFSEHAQLEIREIARAMLRATVKARKFRHSLAAFGYEPAHIRNAFPAASHRQ